MASDTPDDGDFDNDFIAQRRRDLEGAVEYFGDSHKADRELLVVRDFLTNLGIAFGDGDLTSELVGEPVDVSCRRLGACFQVKAILDPGRRLHKDYKDLLEGARKATKAQELLVHYTPEEQTLTELYERIEAQASTRAKHYAASVCRSLDLLFYVSLENVIGLVETPYPDTAALGRLPWRSISFVKGHRACVLAAKDDAPEFLRGAAGTVRHRNDWWCNGISAAATVG